MTLHANYLTLHAIGDCGKAAGMSGAWVRSGALTGAEQLIRELGGDAVALCRQVGIDPGALADPEAPISAVAVVSFLSRAAEACRCETLGLRLASRQDISVLGPLWLLMRHAGTIGELLADLARYFVIHTTGAIVGAHADGEGGMYVTYSMASGLPADDRQKVEQSLGLLCAEMRRRAGPAWEPGAVQFRHSAPADQSWHRRFFGPQLAFDQDRNAVRLGAAVLALPLATADPRSYRIMKGVVESRQSQQPESTLLRVEGALRALLPFSSCSIGEVAGAVSVSSRTLQRQLAAGGTTFQDMRDRVRSDLALKYLRQSRLQLAEISEILGYSEPSAFTRSFKRWHGCSPREARRQQAGAAAVPPSQLSG